MGAEKTPQNTDELVSVVCNDVLQEYIIRIYYIYLYNLFQEYIINFMIHNLITILFKLWNVLGFLCIDMAI